VNINITVLAQIINFWIAYWILRILFFRPTVAAMQKEENEVASLTHTIALKKQTIEEAQTAQKDQWNQFRNFCKFNNQNYIIGKKEHITQNHTKYSDLIDTTRLKKLTDEYTNRLVSFLKGSP
jgi:hypothetical protein